MNYRTVIGIDPGPVPGFVVLNLGAGTRPPGVAQCNADVAPDVLTSLLISAETPVLVALEEFVVSRRAARSRSAAAGAETRRMVEELERAATGITWVDIVRRPAAAVKPWATDERLDAAGLREATKGLRHARDAARHALYAACRDAGTPDPLSRGWPR